VEQNDKPGRPQMAVKRGARKKKDALCVISNYGKNTDSHSQYLIFIAS